MKALIHRPFSSKGVTSALRLKERGGGLGEGRGGEGAHVYGLNSFKTPESLTNSGKPLEKDRARAEPRLGWLLLCELRDRESHIHFCLNEVSDPPPESDTFTTWGIYALQGSEVPVQYEEDRFDSKYILAICPRRFIYRQWSPLKLMLFCSICGGTEMQGGDRTGPRGTSR